MRIWEEVEISPEGMQKFKAVLKALRDGRVTLVGEVNFVETLVPVAMLQGYWRVVRAGPYIVATDKNGNEIGLRYYNPRFGPPLH